jgi:NADPH:quinone reductase-like Zn-dependent oxidoreductase
MMNPTLEDREVVMGMLEREVIKVVTDSVWKFEEAEKAYRHLGDGHAGGKVLVKVDESVGDENY